MAIFLKGKVNDAMAAALADPMVFGDRSEFLGAAADSASIVALDDTTVVVVYEQPVTTVGGQARVGKLTGTKIDWGEPTQLIHDVFGNENEITLGEPHVAALDSTKVVVTYGRNNGAIAQIGMQMRVGIVSGNSITFPFGTNVQVVATSTDFAGRDTELITVDSTHVLYCFRDASDAGKGKALIATVAGNDITLGAKFEFNSVDAHYIRTEMLDATNFVVIYTPNDGVGHAKVGTITGTSIAFGAEATFESPGTGFFHASSDVVVMDASTIIVGYHEDPSKKMITKVGTITGTAISFGAATILRAAGGIASGNAEDLSLIKMAGQPVAFYNGGFFVGPIRLPSVKVGTLAGTTVSWADFTGEVFMGKFFVDGEFQLSANKNAAVLPSGDKAVFINTRAFSIGKVGSLGGDTQGNSVFIEASDPSAYPTMKGADRVTMAVWTNEPTKLSAELIIRRDFVLFLDATGFELTKGRKPGARWDDAGVGAVMAALNDGTPHLLIIDFEHQGGGSWILHTSIDGEPYVDQGLQNSGNQNNNPSTIAPSITLNNPNPVNQWAEEVVMWADAPLFDSDDLANLFELGDTFGLNMDQFVEVFETTGLLASDNVVFYHPLDDAVEDTRTQTWGGAASFGTGQVGDADSALSSDRVTFGTETVFNSAHSEAIAIEKLDDTHVVVIYKNVVGPSAFSRDPGTEMRAVVGTFVSGGVTFGPASAFLVADGFVSFVNSVAVLSPTKIVVSYLSFGRVRLKAGTVSGTSISFGAEILAPRNPVTPSSVGGPFDKFNMVALDSSRFVLVYALFNPANTPVDFNPGGIIVGDVVGTTISLGAVNLFTAGGNLGQGVHVVKLSADRVLISDIDVFKRPGLPTPTTPFKTDGRMWVVDVTGLATVVGPEVLFLQPFLNSQGRTAVAVIDSTPSAEKFVVAYSHTARRIGRTRVGQVTGSSIAFGQEAQFQGVFGFADEIDITALDSAHVVVSWRHRQFTTNLKTKLGTVSGLDITLGGFSSALALGPVGAFAEQQMVAMNDTEVVIVYGDSTGGQDRFASAKVGKRDPAASNLVAPDGTLYPSVAGGTRTTVAFWTQNPTAGDSSVTVERGYTTKYTASTIELGGAVWNDVAIGALMGTLNDGSPHFLVADFENVGVDTWRLRTSLDGLPYADQGQQNTGLQPVVVADTAPQVTVTRDSALSLNQWVDELAYWGGRSDELSAGPDSSTGNESSQGFAIAFLDDTRFVACFTNGDTIGRGTARIGTITGGNTIVWGPLSEFLSATQAFSITVTAMSSDTVVVAYSDISVSPAVGAANVGKVVGGTIVWGTQSVYLPALAGFGVGEQSLVTLDSTHVAVAYANDWLNKGSANVGEVSGSTIAWGTRVNFLETPVSGTSVVRLSSTSFAVAYNNNNASQGESNIGTVTGTDVAFGLQTVFNNSLSTPVSLVAFTPDLLGVAYRDVGNSSKGTMKLGAVSGTSVNWDLTGTVFNTNLTNSLAMVATDSSHVVVHYVDGLDKDGKVEIGTVNGGAITFGMPVVFRSGVATGPIMAPGSAAAFPDGTVVVYADLDASGDPLKGTVVTAAADLFTTDELSNLHSLGATLDKRLDDYGAEFLGETSGSSPIAAGNAIFHHPLDNLTEKLQNQLWNETAVPPTTSPPPCPRCDGGTLLVDEDVAIDFNTVGAPICIGHAGMCDIFSFEKDSGQPPYTWKAIFDAGDAKIQIADGVTVEVLGVPTSKKSKAVPGLILRSLCGVEIADNAVVKIVARTDRAGDISIEAGGDCIINGEIMNIADFGHAPSNASGSITVATDCGTIVTGPLSVIQTLSRGETGDVNLVSCGTGSVTVNGLVNASYAETSSATAPSTINVIAYGGTVAIDGNTVQGFNKKQKRQITSGVTVTSEKKQAQGRINIQAAGDITVLGNILFDRKKPNLGAVGLGTNPDSEDGGTIDVRSLGGKIIASDRAFDASTSFKGDDIADLGSTAAFAGTQAEVNLLAAGDIDLTSTGRLNDPLSFQVATEMAVVTSQAVKNAKGGVNTLRSFAGSVSVGNNACVLADHVAEATLGGQNDAVHCTGATINPGACVRPAATIASDCAITTPIGLFSDCLTDFGIVFPD